MAMHRCSIGVMKRYARDGKISLLDLLTTVCNQNVTNSLYKMVSGYRNYVLFAVSCLSQRYGICLGIDHLVTQDIIM